MDALDPSKEFLAQRPVAGVRFQHNENVQVLSGAHRGEVGSLVSLLSAGEDPCFVLEAESGRDFVVLQSQLGWAGA